MAETVLCSGLCSASAEARGKSGQQTAGLAALAVAALAATAAIASRCVIHDASKPAAPVPPPRLRTRLRLLARGVQDGREAAAFSSASPAVRRIFAALFAGDDDGGSLGRSLPVFLTHGLPNLGQSCWVNAGFQCVCHLPVFYNWLLATDTDAIVADLLRLHREQWVATDRCRPCSLSTTRATRSWSNGGRGRAGARSRARYR